MKRYLILVLLLFVGLSQGQVRIDYPEPKESLGYVIDLKLDNDKLWVLGTEGLWFHHGDSYVKLLTKDGKEFPQIESIAPSDSGIWLGFHSDGIAHFNSRKHTLQRIENTIRIPDQRVGGIFSVTNEGIWFQAHHKGLCYLNISTNQLRHILPTSMPEADSTHRGQNIVTKIHFNADSSKIYIATLNGLLIYSLENSAFDRYYGLERENLISGDYAPQVSSIRDFHVNGNFAWLATYGGLVSLNLSSGEFSVFLHSPRKTDRLVNNFRSIICYQDSLYRLIDTEYGVYFFNKRDHRFASDIPYYKGAYSQLTTDLGIFTAGNSWLSLESHFGLRQLKHSPSPSIQDFRILNSGKLAIKDKQDPISWSIEDSKLASVDYNRTYYGLFQDQENRVITVWFSEVRIESSDGEKKIIGYPWGKTSDTRFNISTSWFDEEKNKLWIGTKEQGVWVYDFNKTEWKAYDYARLKRNWINAFFRMDTLMVVISETELHVIDSDGEGRFEYSVNPVGPDPGSIFNGALWRDDGLWLHSFRDGLFHYQDLKATVLLEHYDPSDYGSERLNSFVHSEGKLFLALDNGLLQVDENHHAHLFGESFGIGKVKRLGKYNGEVIFHTRDQILRIPKTGLNEEALSYNSGIISLEVNGNRLYQKDEIRLSHDQNWLEWEVYSGSLKAPSYGDWKYNVSGLDTIWRKVRDNRIVLTNLPKGQFDLRLRHDAEDKGKGVIDSVASWTISPAWWNTLLFRIVLVCLIAVLTWQIYSYRLQQQRKSQEIEFEYRDKLRSLELRMLRVQMNPHFIFNALNSVRYYILKKERKQASDYLVRFSKLLRFILNASQKEAVSLKEELEGITNYIEFERMRFGEHFSWKLNVSKQLETDGVRIWPMLLQPFVENAIWHGLMPKESEAHLTIDVNKRGNQLIIVIEDNGIGRKEAETRKAKVHQSFGLSITADRLKMLGEQLEQSAEYRIDDLHHNGKAVGTRVTLVLPYDSLDS